MNEIGKVFEGDKETRPHPQLNDDFIRIMHSVFSAARCFGVPVCGGGAARAWAALLLALHVCIEGGSVYKLVKNLAGLTAYSTGNRSVVARLSGAIFYGNALLSLVVFWRLRVAWARLLRDWAGAERGGALPLPPDKALRRNLWLVVAVVAVCSCVEHGMSMAANINLDYPPPIVFKEYILNSHAFLIIPSDYSLPLGIAIFVISKAATILWNFQDMVIILVSLGLASRYGRLNKYVHHLTKMESISGHTGSENDSCMDEYASLQAWRRVREAFVRQAALVRRADAELGSLILLSNSNNFYFICLQVFNGAGGEDGMSLNKVYYLTSVAWLCARACAVVLAAAEVNVRSRTALGFIYEYPDRSYNVE
ncbi:hypothetical protein JYU34_022782, partial [Plutella xylostella]